VDRLETIVACMAPTTGNPDIQSTQTRFRMDLVDGWQIEPGASVLEVGCGQGDMTAVLAEAVGPTGRVLGVDIAHPDYGTPITVGDSATHLMNSPLGNRIEMRFETNVLDRSVTFTDQEFDHVVLSHCTWYFESMNQVEQVLTAVQPWAAQLCFAEWDLTPRSAEQLPHLLAVLMQGEIETAGTRGNGNIRTPFSRQALNRALDRTGWSVSTERSLHGTALQDADWEITAAKHLATSPRTGLPQIAQDFVDSQMDVLHLLAKPTGNQPLHSYALTAHKQ